MFQVLLKDMNNEKNAKWIHDITHVLEDLPEINITWVRMQCQG